MRGPLANGLYPTELYNGDPVPEGQQGYLANYLRFVGGARLRQLRVRNDSCFERRFTGLQAKHGNQVCSAACRLCMTCGVHRTLTVNIHAAHFSLVLRRAADTTPRMEAATLTSRRPPWTRDRLDPTACTRGQMACLACR